MFAQNIENVCRKYRKCSQQIPCAVRKSDKLISAIRQKMHMELDELSRRVAEEARALQKEIENLLLPKDACYATGSIESTLSRIEERLIKVHDHTGILVERVPENLSSLLLEIKGAVLERIDSLKRESPGSKGSTESDKSGQAKGDSFRNALLKLTPQERKLFQICFQSGLITYKELGQRLDITSTSAKNIVNRLFKNNAKRRLFSKRHIHGIARVGIDEAVQKRILSGQEKGSNKSKKGIPVIEE